MITYVQQTKYDCGIRALSCILQIPYETIKELWGWKDYNDFRDNLLDSHFHHFNVLTNLNVKYHRITCDDILNGRYYPNKTMALLHFEDNPYFNQHWVIMVDPVKYTRNSEILAMDYGDGTVRLITKNELKSMMTSGFPECAYIVGEGNSKISWYEKMYCKLIGLFV